VVPLGELPLPNEAIGESKKSTLQKNIAKFKDFPARTQTCCFLKFMPSDSLEADITEVLDIAMISGQKNLSPKMCPCDKRWDSCFIQTSKG
jgi:hypothetical protein